MFGLDYVSGPAIDALKSAGVGFVCRYLSEVNNLTEVKLLKADEAKQLSAAGIAIVSNYEWYASRATEGYASGVADAQIANAQHAACGGPGDRPIYFSVDQDVEGSQVADYFRGVASVIGLSRTGAYGSYRVIKYLFDQGLITWGWQTYAWSYGLWEDRAHIQQYQNDMYVGGASVDFNRSTKSDFGQWLVGETMQNYSSHSADFNNWFTVDSNGNWLCKQTGKTIQGAILTLYEKLSIDGQSLPILGLPMTGEITWTINGKTVVLMVFERGGIYADHDNVKDNQPGISGLSICKLTDIDFLQHIPGLPTATKPDTSTVVSLLKSLPTDAQRQAALAALGA